MTEEDARKKWCPFARQMIPEDRNGVPDGFGVANRYPSGGPVGICVASACMAWRLYTHTEDGGYCGLAGNTGRIVR